MRTVITMVDYDDSPPSTNGSSPMRCWSRTELSRPSALCSAPADGRVLDCAAGTGQLAVGLAARGLTVVASNASPVMVERTVSAHRRPVSQRILPLGSSFSLTVSSRSSAAST